MPQWQSHHGVPTAFAHPADHLFIGQHRAQRRAPVDRCLRLIGQPLLVAVGGDGLLTSRRHLGWDRQFGNRPAPLGFAVEPGVVQDQEDPLGPADVARVGGGHLPVPVVTEAEHLQLAAEGGDVSLGTLPWRGAGTDGMFLCGQAEGVKTHRVDHADAPHPGSPTDDVGGGVALGVADMQPITAGIGKHVEDVGLLVGRQPRGTEGVVLVPPSLPFRLDGGGVVLRHELRMGQGWERWSGGVPLILMGAVAATTHRGMPGSPGPCPRENLP